MALSFTIVEKRITNELLPTPGGGKTNNGYDSSIGAPMLFEIDVELDAPDVMAGMKWSFYPALFVGPALPSFNLSRGYFLTLPAVVSDPSYKMGLVTGNAYTNTQRNFRAGVYPTSSTEATLKLLFRMTMDVSGYIGPEELQNWKRFVRPELNAPDSSNSMVSVYRNTDRRLFCYLRLENPAGEVQMVPVELPMASRYYEQGLPEASTEPPSGTAAQAAEFAPGLSIALFRNGIEVNNFNATDDTEVRVHFDVGTTYALGSSFMVYRIKLNRPNASHFMSDYGSQGTTITNAATEDEELGYGIRGVASCIDTEVVAGVNKNRLRFKVKASELDPAIAYGLVIVVHGAPVADTDQTFSNSFFYRFEGIAADGDPTPVDMEGKISGSLSDYNTDPGTDVVVSTVVDHLRSRVTVDASEYDGAQPFVTTWGADLFGITLRFEDADTDEFLWSVGFLRQGSEFVDANGGGGNTVTEEVDGDEYHYRTTLNMCYPNDAGLPDFSGRVIRLTWRFEMGYPSESLQVRYTYPQYFGVNGYQAFAGVIQAVNLYEYQTGLPLTNLCTADQVLVEVLLDPTLAGSDTWNLRAFWSLENHGYQFSNEARPGATKEAEGYASPVGELVQLSDPSLIAVPPVFVDNRALFIFDHSQVPNGQRARIHVIAQPEAGTDCNCAEAMVTVTLSDYAPISATTGAAELRCCYPDGGDEATFFAITEDHGAGLYCIRSTDSGGTNSGTLTTLQSDSPFVTAINFAGSAGLVLPYVDFQFTGLTAVVFPAVELGSLQMPLNPFLASLDLHLATLTTASVVNCSHCPSLVALDLPVGHQLKDLQGTGCAFSSITVDAIINSFDPLIPGISITLNGGSSGARTAASDAVHDAIILNGGIITTNP